MAIRFSSSRRPSAVPEHLLWTLQKDGHTVEARTCMTPIGPELRIHRGCRLLWSQTFPEGHGTALGALADVERHEYRARGWTTTDY